MEQNSGRRKRIANQLSQSAVDLIVSTAYTLLLVAQELHCQCLSFAEALLSHSRSSTELAVLLNYDPEAPPYEGGHCMKLRRLELAIDCNQKGVSYDQVVTYGQKLATY